MKNEEKFGKIIGEKINSMEYNPSEEAVAVDNVDSDLVTEINPLPTQPPKENKPNVQHAIEASQNRSFAERMNTKIEKKTFDISVAEFMDAGSQFGHKPQYTHPSMKKYIFGTMNGIAIINLDHSIKMLENACKFLETTALKDGKILWVGIRKNIKDQTVSCAKRSGGFYINYRWTPGLLTNFETLRLNLQRRADLQKTLQKEAHLYTKKERLLKERQIQKIELMYGGLKEIEGIPKVIVILDAANQHIAITEAKKMGIPVVAIADSNCNIQDIDYAIPANDDASKSVQFVSDILASFVISGVTQRLQNKPLIKMSTDNKFDKDSQPRGRFTDRKFTGDRKFTSYRDRKPMDGGTSNFQGGNTHEKRNFSGGGGERRPFSPIQRQPYNPRFTTGASTQPGAAPTPGQASSPYTRPPSTGGYTGSRPPSTGGYAGSRPPSTGGYAGSRPPSTGGYAGSRPPSTGGYAGSRPPSTGGYAGTRPYNPQFARGEGKTSPNYQGNRPRFNNNPRPLGSSSPMPQSNIKPTIKDEQTNDEDTQKTE